MTVLQFKNGSAHVHARNRFTAVIKAIHFRFRENEAKRLRAFECFEIVLRGPKPGFEAFVSYVLGMHIEDENPPVLKLYARTFRDGAASLFRSVLPFLPGLPAVKRP